MMVTELVESRAYMTYQEFLTGFGLVQGLPGPMFSFSAYAGGMITIAAVILMQGSGFDWENLLVTLLTVGLLLTKKIPAPLIVLTVLVAGFVF